MPEVLFVRLYSNLDDAHAAYLEKKKAGENKASGHVDKYITRCMACWNSKILLQFKESDIVCLDLCMEEKELGKELLREIITTNTNLKIIIYSGHGLPNSWQKSDKVSILNAEDVDLFEGKLVFSLACYTSASLGRKAVAQGGALCYVGYSDKFLVHSEPQFKHVFKDTALFLINYLMNNSGSDIAEAEEKTQERISQYYDMFTGDAGEKDINRFAVGVALIMNSLGLEVHGNKGIKLSLNKSVNFV